MQMLRYRQAIRLRERSENVSAQRLLMLNYRCNLTTVAEGKSDTSNNVARAALIYAKFKTEFVDLVYASFSIRCELRKEERNAFTEA